jgi:hypothetical protein
VARAEAEVSGFSQYSQHITEQGGNEGTGGTGGKGGKGKGGKGGKGKGGKRGKGKSGKCGEQWGADADSPLRSTIYHLGRCKTTATAVADVLSTHARRAGNGRRRCSCWRRCMRRV